MGLIMIFLSPRFLIGYIEPVLGFSLFIYLIKAFKGFYLTIRGHQLNYGILHKTVIDLKVKKN